MRYPCVLALLLCGCGEPSGAIAELVKAEGPVERQEGSEAWKAARLGARYFLGDAARTWDGPATLGVGGGAARILMQSHTVLRFGGTPGEHQISVEVGAIDLSGTDSYTLDVGTVKLSRDSAVRVRANRDGRSSIELIVGDASVTANKQTFELAISVPIEIGRDGVAPVDAGVRDAPIAAVDAAIDAAIDAEDAVGEATIAVTGRRAEVLAPGETRWQPLPAGAGALARGTTVRLGANTTARLVAGPTTLALAGGARVKLGDDLAFSIELGDVRAVATGPGSIALPGGDVTLAGAPEAAAEASLEAGARDTRIKVLRGASRLTGDAGAELALSRGEAALLTARGVIRVVESIPGYFDFRVGAGDSLTIHDPRPPTAVQFRFNGKCAGGGIIEVDRDARFRTAKVSSGREFANVLLSAGKWAYRLRCTANGTEGNAVAAGRVIALRDAGRRPLPKAQRANEIDADGRNYRISYQSVIPSVAVRVRSPGTRHMLHLASRGRERTFESSTATVTIPGSQLDEGTYTYWVDRDGVKQDKVSTLIIDFDQTAPQVYIESPANAQAWTGDISVRGAVLPEWSAAVDGVDIPIDGQRRFAAKVGIPVGNALAIKLSHPQRGIHYYLRRQK